MKFSTGYQLRKDDLFLTAVLENARQLSEVYFALPQFANGRGTAWCKAAFCTAPEQQNKQLRNAKNWCDGHGKPYHVNCGERHRPVVRRDAAVLLAENSSTLAQSTEKSSL